MKSADTATCAATGEMIAPVTRLNDQTKVRSYAYAYVRYVFFYAAAMLKMHFLQHSFALQQLRGRAGSCLLQLAWCTGCSCTGFLALFRTDNDLSLVI